MGLYQTLNGVEMRDGNRRCRFTSRKAATTAVVLATLLAIGGGATASASAGGAAATPTVVSATRKKALALPTPGLHTVESIALTAGTWTVVAKASAIGPGGGDFFRCQLIDVTHGTVLDGSTTFLKDAVPRDVITNLAVIKAKGAVTISYECGHDGDAGDAGSIDAGASLVGFVTPASRVRVARSTMQANLSSTPVGIVNLSLTKGTWVIAAKVTPVALSEPEAVGVCNYGADDFQREVGTDSADHAVSTIFKVDATAKLSTTTTFTLLCRGNTGVYLDPGAVFWAWKASDLESADTDTCPVTAVAGVATDAVVLHERNCDIRSGSFPSQMIGARLSAGTWVGLSGFDTLLSESVNVARCQILDANHGKQLDESSTAEGDFFGEPLTGITNVTVVTVKKTLDVEGRCGQDTTDADATALDSGWAFIRP
jgi:hypothetical protein